MSEVPIQEAGSGQHLSADVVVIGGGVIGSAAAYFLTRAESALRVIVVEPDPTYEWAASPRATGGIRRLFSLPENIEMSKFSLDFYVNFNEYVGIPGNSPADVLFKQQGYLFIVPPSGVKALEQSHRQQTALGVRVELLEPQDLKRKYPSMEVNDLGGAALSPEDGYVDANSALQGFRKRARHQGVTYVQDRVVGVALDGRRAGPVLLDSGATIDANVIINAAGTWSADICRLIGMQLPVEPMQRFDHFFECDGVVESLPFIKDVHGLGFHPEGSGYTGSVVNHKIAAGHNFNVDHAYFETIVWPHLAERFPVFEALKERSSWAAHYDRNTLDGNMILGNWASQVDNFYVAAGFSGHGLMHAPAVGRALAELILTGRYQTLDLGRMNYERVGRGEPYAETGIK